MTCICIDTFLKKHFRYRFKVIKMYYFQEGSLSLKIVYFSKDLTTSPDALQTQMYKGIEGSEVLLKHLTYTSLIPPLRSLDKLVALKGNKTIIGFPFYDYPCIHF